LTLNNPPNAASNNVGELALDKLCVIEPQFKLNIAPIALDLNIILVLVISILSIDACRVPLFAIIGVLLTVLFNMYLDDKFSTPLIDMLAFLKVSALITLSILELILIVA
jgi:hypothetical protein